MRGIFLRNCGQGDLVDDVYVLSGKQFATTNGGKPFMKGAISDRTCQMQARMWNAAREVYDRLPDGGFVHVRGHLETYQNNLQLIIEQIWPAREGSYDVFDLLPQSGKDISAMCRRLAEVLGSIQNRHLAALVQAYLDDESLMTDFCRAPAAMSFHHAFLGGLLEHTLNAIEVADCIVRFYPGLNRDLVIAGIFLHDIAKTWELSYTSAFKYTDGGQLVGHIVKSAMWVEHKAREAEAVLGEKIPQRLIDVLQHIILSHHGQMEFGAPKVPATPEALAVHLIENMDAKLIAALHITRGNGVLGDGNWTEYVKMFDGRLFRPDVASAEEPDAEVASEPAPQPMRIQQKPSDIPPPNAPVADAPLRITNPLFEPASRQPKQ